MFVRALLLALAAAYHTFARKAITSLMRKESIRTNEASQTEESPPPSIVPNMPGFFPPESRERAWSIAIEEALHIAFKKESISPLYTICWRERNEIVARREEFGINQLLFDQRSLNIPLVDFDPVASFHMVAAESCVFDKEPPSASRSIPMLCTVRGMGAGKSRALQEVCFEALLEHHHCLAVGVTFNSNSELMEPEENIWGKLIEASAGRILGSDVLIFSVCCRMLSSFYNVEFASVLASLGDILLKLPHQWSGKVLFITVTNHLLFHARQHRPIDKFLLLIDEAKNAQIELTNIYGVKDPYGVLRSVLLSPLFYKKLARPMLIISSLTVLPVMMASPSSKREIVAIPLPETLNGTKVSQILLEKLASANVQNCTEAEIALWASLFNNVPRTLEYALVAVDNAADSVRTGMQHVAFDAAFTTAWLQNIYHMCRPYRKGIDGRLLRQLILSEAVSVMDEPVRDSIERSMFINSLKEMPDKNENGVYMGDKIVPIASSLLLWVRLTNDLNFLADQDNSMLLKEMRTLVTKVMEFMEQRQSIRKKGDASAKAGLLLKHLMTGIVKLRLLASTVPRICSGDSSSRELFRPSVSIRKLFALPDDFGVKGFLDVKIDLCSVTQGGDLTSSNVAALSWKQNSREPFLKELSALVVSKDNPIRLLKFGEFERADGGLLIYRGTSQAPLLILWDCKSRSPNGQKKVSKRDEKDWEQAHYWFSLLPPDVRIKSTAIKYSYGQSALRALADGQVFFIYADDELRTNVVAMKWLDGEMAEATNEDEKRCPLAIRLNRRIMNEVLVFCAPLYSAARSLYDKEKLRLR